MPATPSSSPTVVDTSVPPRPSIQNDDDESHRRPARRKPLWSCVRPRLRPVMYCRHPPRVDSTDVSAHPGTSPLVTDDVSSDVVAPIMKDHRAWSTTSQHGSTASSASIEAPAKVGHRRVLVTKDDDAMTTPPEVVDEDARSKITALTDVEPNPTLYDDDFYKLRVMFAQSKTSPYPQFKSYLGSKAGDLTPYEAWPTPSMAPGDEMDDDVIGKDIEEYAVPHLPSKEEEEVFAVPDFDVDTRPELAAVDVVCKRYKSIFSNKIGRCDVVEHEIETYDARPTREKPRRIPHAYRDDIVKQLDDLEKQGVIRRSKSPYAAPCVYVAKKDGLQ
ncbi:hypothetical protein FOZ63_010365 [Perkinsus olseni]|uniref:Uncharacterized protein n=1 Tax=Perkinsus olseni TaxID=32597 RepID=A0A7J6UMI9_PEROL|nr:hypothetical protein FOZ63_010365 [Perkinsus olseni]